MIANGATIKGEAAQAQGEAALVEGGAPQV